MGKLVFYYGVMGCAKTANALMTKFQYESKNKLVWLIKPSIDNRDDIVGDTGEIQAILKSRIGLSARADVIKPNMDITIAYFDSFQDLEPDVIIADEAQFFTAAQIDQLKWLSNHGSIVLCYGLRTDFQTNLFDGSKRLFELADNIIELESICDCGKKAIINARIDNNGKILYTGNQIEIGGNEKYKAVCWDCYIKNKKRRNKMKVYLACSFAYEDKTTTEIRKQAMCFVEDYLKDKNFTVYNPCKLKIENAWDYSYWDWGNLVFESDKREIDACDFLVFISYGKENNAGSVWEVGYAFAKNKPIIMISMDAESPESLMVMHSAHACLDGFADLFNYDFDKLPRKQIKRVES